MTEHERQVILGIHHELKQDGRLYEPVTLTIDPEAFLTMLLRRSWVHGDVNGIPPWMVKAMMPDTVKNTQGWGDAVLYLAEAADGATANLEIDDLAVAGLDLGADNR